MNDIAYNVITVGSNTIDAFVYTDRVESMSMKNITSESTYICYPLGSKLRVSELDFYTGGGGTNTAVCLSRLGLKTGYIGAVGDDINGNIIMEELKSEKIAFLGSVLKKNKTGYSIVLDSIERNRTILTHRGANDHLVLKESDLDKFNTAWFHFSAMLMDSFKTLEKIAEYALKNGIKICFNPNNYLAEKGKEYIKKILSCTSILILNDEEASLLVKERSVKNKLKALKKTGPDIVIITKGVNPIHCIGKKDEYYTVYPIDIKVVETTGAGDSFSSSFLAGMINKSDIESALKLAIVNSHSVLRHKGAKNILLTSEQAEKEATRNPVKIIKDIVT
jgi:sugar/nucleoside kinase (ribokinase family)